MNKTDILCVGQLNIKTLDFTDYIATTRQYTTSIRYMIRICSEHLYINYTGKQRLKQQN